MPAKTDTDTTAPLTFVNEKEKLQAEIERLKSENAELVERITAQVNAAKTFREQLEVNETTAAAKLTSRTFQTFNTILGQYAAGGHFDPNKLALSGGEAEVDRLLRHAFGLAKRATKISEELKHK